MDEIEINFDGLVGPTHNFAGLSHGNLASMKNVDSKSNPKRAALEGLEKMRFVASLGVPQAVLPPHERPNLRVLRELGFSGGDAEILDQVGQSHPLLLACVSSASAMWAANAATVSPSANTADGRVHFTPANLSTQFHRSIEPALTCAILQKIFVDESRFAIHAPLPTGSHFADEGAANHTRLTSGEHSCELFAWGRIGFDLRTQGVTFPARQTREACEAITRNHALKSSKLVRQHPDAINAGAFHNDVVAVGHRHVLLLHEQAWEHQSRFLEVIRSAIPDLQVIEVPASELSLRDAVSSYLFNSQLVTVPSGEIHLIAPAECATLESSRRVCDALPKSRIAQTHFVDVRESMKNGGGPACLRLRVPLTGAERDSINSSVVLDDALYGWLKRWIEKHYRSELTPADLRDPKLLDESRRALDELSQRLRLGSIYDFQK